MIRARPSELSFVNIGMGEDLTIRELAELIRRIVGYEGAIAFNPDMPDGTPRKLLDSSRIRALGWQPKHSLEQGLRQTYEWFQEQRLAGRL